MKNLNKIKEEGKATLNTALEIFKVAPDAINKRQIILLVKALIKEEVDKAHSLAIDEVEQIVDEYIDPSGETMNEADMVLNILKQKLLELKNKNNG